MELASSPEKMQITLKPMAWIVEALFKASSVYVT
ncbi:MAG: hypothetical protein ACJAU2_000918 [Maribacter sp.]|jgi:hypothetical protein